MLQEHTSLKSLSTCISRSQDWQGLPLSMLRPFMVLLFPPSDADTTGEDIDNALSRRKRSICGGNGPPSTN